MRTRRAVTPARVLLVAMATVLLGSGAAVMAVADPLAGPTPPTAYQLKLRAAVDTTAGGPRAGRDPALQKQTTLAAAARQPVGNGTRGGKPARAATQDHARDVQPGQVLPSPASGVLASGCVTGYGKPGEQCLPTPGPGIKLTCMDLMDTFPRGIAVVGTDRFRLDSNRDGIACGPGDAM